MLVFNNADVAAKYTSTFKGDPVVHYPGGKNRNGFKVKLSAISLEQADRLFAMKNQNLLQAKTGSPAAAKVEKPAEKVKDSKIP